MGLLSKIKNAIAKKKIEKSIREKNADNTLVLQEKFDKGLVKSSSALGNFFNSFKKKTIVDQELIDTIEEQLISFDIGISSTTKILDAIIEELKNQKELTPQLIKEVVYDKLLIYYIQDTIIESEMNIKDNKTNVVLVTGVNGVGKTTSIAKLAYYFLNRKKTVCLVAGDTFRAGAVAQLEEWSKRLNVQIFKAKKEGQDPASVIYDGVKWASENKIDVVLCDTSGRLQSKINLMNELKKINDIIKKFDQEEPCESLLVLDATTGQNGIFQAKAFNEITKLTGIILTKMDSTSKGGIVLSIKDVFKLPIKFIGLGEKIDDLLEFDISLFINGLVKNIDVE